MARADDCIAAVREALGPQASDDAVAQVFERVDARRKRLAAEGRVDRLQERLRALVADDADAARVQAAKARQHAALNAIVRDRLETTILGHVEAGLDVRKAVLAVLEGTVRGVAGGRVSVAATRLAYAGRFAGDMLAAIQRGRPHLATRRALQDKRLSDDTVREMAELREGGAPGSTKNDDARFLARTFATFAELSRTDLNRLGAAIGKLDGWAGPQAHDAFKLMAAGRDRWVAAVLPRLDVARSFPGAEPANAVRILRDVYDTIVTGVRPAASATERGEFTMPSSVASALEQHRVLHFKTPDDWIAYADEFGSGNLFAAIWAHQEVAARVAAQMQVMGPNPEVMMGSLLESLRRRVRNDPDLPDARKAKLARALTLEGHGSVGSAWAEVTGFTVTPANATAAAWGTGIRATQSLAKLGGAVISSASDLVTAAANMKFHGQSFLGALGRQVAEFVTVGRGKGEQREIAFLAHVGFDSLIDHMNARYVAEDSAPGWIARRSGEFFRWSGLTGWTERNRAVAARTLMAELGGHIGTGFDALPRRYRHVLSLHGIGERQWTALQAAGGREVDGRVYVTPERIRALDDLTVGRLVEGRVTAAKIVAARRDLELAVRRMIADETRFGVIETDPASRRLTTWGTQPGTLAGEAIRFVMQFKGFPIAFTQRVLGRAAFGGPGVPGGGGGGAGAGHIGSLIAGLMVAGYASMTLKDMLRGYAPRNPFDADHILKILPAVLAQSGGAGIYGDFLFGQANRMGGNVLETLAGPAIGGAAGFVELYQQARSGEAKAGTVLSRVLQEVPYINIFYARPALDYLALNALRERASPGFAARQRAQRLRDYGQRPLFQ